MNNLDQLFPGLSNSVYLNTPAMGLIPQNVYNYKKDILDLHLQHPTRYFENYDSQLNQVTNYLKRLLRVKTGNIAFTPNFSFGFHGVLSGISPKSKILVIENEYPSISLAVKKWGFQFCEVALKADVEESIIDAFNKEQPDVFIFSIIQYLNGLKLNAALIKDLKQTFPKTLFIADGTQFCGTEFFNFEESGIDILGVSAYKWLHAGWGSAFFIFRKGLEMRVQPKTIGSNAVNKESSLQAIPLHKKLEPGHLDLMQLGSLAPALETFFEIGEKKIYKKIEKISRTAKSAFAELNLLENQILKQRTSSPIFNLQIDTRNLAYLNNQNIICAQRGQGIRVGFHYYNSIQDLNYLLKALKTLPY
ncbi:aminotransferase class V-fold PLP-dependent enzyme [uncultured Mesonia sp.]|uniref:aminotransferase class V-fold PLP-dependent enzyme n=1 Tax=uncultured Mesonia sp. TaxID=399731 RepID=UPI00374EBEBF